MNSLHIVIWWRQRASLGNVSRAVHKDVVSRNSTTLGITVQVGRNSKLGVREIALLNKDLGAHAGVNSRRWVVLEAGAVDVSGTESEGWQARVNVGEVVVVVGNTEVSGILRAIAIGMSDERSFPLTGGQFLLTL